MGKKLSENFPIETLQRLVLLCLLLSGCSGDNEINNTGYDSITRPQSPTYTPPGYYYHQPGYPPRPVPAPTSAPYYQQQQQNPYQQGYSQTAPGSRYYANPYDIPPAGNSGYNQYDADQYYVPPTRYNNNETQNNGYNSAVKNSGAF